MEQNRKIINNAILCYPMLLISWLFLFAKNNPFLQNTLVKNHAKTATFLHLLLFVNVLIFLVFKLFGAIAFFGIGLNIILANTIFVFLFLSMGVGIYKANKGESFGVSESIHIHKKEIISVTKNTSEYKEEDKLTILFSYIPLIGLIKTIKYDNNPEIRANIVLNLVVFTGICIIYILGYTNIASLLILAYSIFIAFIGINIFTKNEHIHITFPDFLVPEKNIISLKAGITYIWKYIQGKFERYEIILKNIQQQDAEKQKALLKKAQESKTFQGPKWVIYLPILNIFTLFQKHSNYSSHIYNGAILTLLFILTSICILLGMLPLTLLFLFLIPICIGIGKVFYPVYRMPYIYDIYELFTNMKHTILHTKKSIQEKQAKISEERFVVGEKDQVPKDKIQKK